ncbi:MAG: phosphotransferase [Allobranchiibius sp.]
MHERTMLGPADVTDEQLTALVAALLHEPSARIVLLNSHAERVAYDLPAITTAGRYWVRGEAAVDGARQPFCFFVKHVQSWGRSALFEGVPTEIAQMAEAGVPWRTEPLAYRSDLGDRLPLGLRMPRAVGVFDLDEKSASVWMEEVATVPAHWSVTRFARAAYLLGRLAASPEVRVRADVGEFDWTVRDYVHGRLVHQVLPMMRDRGIWSHPLIAVAFDDTLRGRLQAAADRAEDLVDELSGLPVGSVHGDACPNNLLVTAGNDGFVLIDYGFFSAGPLGFDLGQLLVGDIQVGRQKASTLKSVEDVILPSYVEGLRAEGCGVPLDVIRRAHALHLMLFTGLSAFPFEHLDADLTPALRDMAAERASIARFSLGLLEATESSP